jgi:cobalt-zinc-cadmium efflux system outer membrane protein
MAWLKLGAVGFKRVIKPLRTLAPLAALAWAGALRAEAPAGPAQLTLGDARRVALQRNDDFRVAQIQVAAALAQLRAAREFPNPTLGLSTAKINTDGQPNGTPQGNTFLDRSYDSIASLSQLFLIGKRGLIQDAAATGVRAAESQRDDARRLLVQAVTQAYVAALEAQEQAAVLSESAAALRREATIAARRLQAGDLSASDEAQIEIAAEQDELNADSQRATARTAVVTLEIVLGEPQPNGRTALADNLAALAKLGGPGLEDARVGARPDLAAAEENEQQAETNLELQRRQRIPDVTVSVQYERNPPSQPNTVGLGLSLPLPLWNRNTGEILAAQAARDQAQAQLDKVRIQAAADVAAARVAYEEASARVQRYLTSLAPKSAQATKRVSYAYEKGGASLVDLLEAQRNDNSIRLGTVQAQADAATSAVNLQTALAQLQP